MIRGRSLLLVLSAVLPGFCFAQSDQPAASPAASQQSTAGANGQSSPAAGKTEKTKKVWTNDEVATLPGTVSVVGTNRAPERQAQSSQNRNNAAAEARRGKVLRYRATVAELRKKIDAADQRISRMKNFRANDSSPSGGVNPYRGYNMTPPDEQVKQLEAKKKQWLASIEDLENQAKREGIEPGELR